ncbi:hypothetical protein, partial [Erwinia sp. S59]|uniref:hypothetical protein n=1 Tax=Erwinia sp. S59 TaxID=2769340 RepID=UPI0025723089
RLRTERSEVRILLDAPSPVRNNQRPLSEFTSHFSSSHKNHLYNRHLSPVWLPDLFPKTKIANAFKAFAVKHTWRQPKRITLK